MDLARNHTTQCDFHLALRAEKIEQDSHALFGWHDARDHGAKAFERAIQNGHLVTRHDLRSDFNNLIVARKLPQFLDDIPGHDGGLATEADNLGDPHRRGNKTKMCLIGKPREHVSGEQCFLEPFFAAHGRALEAQHRTKDLESRLRAQKLRGEFLVLGLRFQAEPKQIGRFDDGSVIHGRLHFQEGRNQRHETARLVVPRLQALDARGKSLRRLACRVLDDGLQLGEALIGALHLDRDLVAHPPPDQRRDLGFCLEIFLPVARDVAGPDRANSAQHTQPLTGLALADAKLCNKIIQSERFSTREKKPVDLADRPRQGKVFAHMNKEVEHLALGGAEPHGGSASGGKPRRGGAANDAVAVWQGLDEGDRSAARKDRLMQLWVQGEVGRLTNLRAAQNARSGNPGPEMSVAKLEFANFNKALYDFCIDLMGMAGQVGYDYTFRRPTELDATGAAKGLQYAFLRVRANSIEGGTSEVLKNIIGEQVLGLPGEPRVDKEPPWSQVPRS